MRRLSRRALRAGLVDVGVLLGLTGVAALLSVTTLLTAPLWGPPLVLVRAEEHQFRLER